MTTPVITRVDLDAEPVYTRNGARGDVPRREGERSARRYDGTDAPPAAGELKSSAGNGDLDRPELEKGEQALASVLGC